MNSNPKQRMPFELKTIFWLFAALVIWQIISLFSVPKSATQASDLTIENILQAVSAERTSRNLTSLNHDSRLSSAAQYKSNDMMNRHYFSHTDPEGNYIWGKITEAGYGPYLQLGENLAIEFYNTESLVAAWMNSPTHRANILNEGFKDNGMGLAFGVPSQGQYYSSIANTFGSLVPAKKKTAPPPAKPAPKTESQPPAKVAAAQLPAEQTPAPKPEPVKTETPAPIPEPIPAQEIKEPELPTQTVKSLPASPPKEPLRSSPEDKAPANLSQNFILPGESAEPAETPIEPPQLLIPQAPKQPGGLSAYEVNRYLMLGLGAILLVMVISDLKKMLETKFHAYDKKINNLVLLILSLIVITLMYWL